MTGYVARILPFSAVDGPGNRTVIFLQGCNLNCAYCHNPETIALAKDGNVPEGASAQTVDQVIDQVMKYSLFISGVTISGGECTVQFNFLMEVVKALKAKDLHVLIDTNGMVALDKLQQLMQVADGFMLDVKAYGEDVHKALTGASNHNSKQTLDLLLLADKLYEARTVIVPDLMDGKETVTYVAARIAAIDPAVRYKIITYRSHGVRQEMKAHPSPSVEDLQALKAMAEKIGCENVLLV